MTVATTDSVCLNDPTLGPIIARHLENAQEDQASACAELAEQISTGRVVLRDQELNIDKVKKYMDEWC